MRLYICVFVIFIGFIEGEYIDCKATCIPMNKKLDFVYYEIEAVVKRSKINGNLTNFYCKDCNVENPFNNLNGNEVYATLRSFQSTANQNQSKFCEMQNGYDGRSGLLAPCLMVNPGQTLIVKVINNFPNAIDLLQSGPPSKTEWWETLPTRKRKQQKIHQMHSANNDPENNPGYAFNKKVFDVFNVHFHGLETVPHMFNPLGTLEPTAPWISIFPEYMMMKNETRYDTNNQCFCYHLPISKTMSTGTFLYHVHRQGSQAMQIWSGMIGLIQVGNRNYKNSFDYILPNKFNVQKDYALSIWAPSLRFNGTAELFSKNFKKNDDGSVNPNSKTAEMQLNSWLHSVSISIEPILINNDYQPTIIINKNEIVRFRVVCLMVSIFCAFAIVPDIKNIDPTLADNQIEFYIIANDGIGIQNPIKQKRLVLSSAQRADILIKLEKPMQYQMRMDNVYELTAPMPGTNTLLGYIQVKNNKKKSNIKYKTSNYPINKWILPISIRPSIRKEEIIATKTFIFNTFASKRGIMPTGIASINHSLFKFNRIDYEIVGGTAVEFVLIAPEGVHSIHIHVNPFQIISAYSNDAEINLKNPQLTIEQNNYPFKWRDVAVIPPNGNLTIWIRNAATNPNTGEYFTGKTVYHCHLLDDEDIGMMQTVVYK